MGKDRRVCYFYDSSIGNHYFGPNHPMKPHRVTMAHHLVLAYDLDRDMDCYRPRLAGGSEMAAFHSEDYVDFLRRVTPGNQEQLLSQMQRFSVGEDCPVFDGVWRFCQSYTGASIDAATKLNYGQYDVAINWSGGLHHAKKAEASGFCYVNDLVLCILELLKYHPRVLYIDIDIHHGDGVEEAFYATDRVMCVSFHKYGDNFFPGTGALRDIGHSRGKHYSVNVPLKDGIDDDDFLALFKPIINKTMEMYRPGAVVLQCGADSLANDRLGCFSLSLQGHAECVRHVRSFGVPLVVTGGGGYTKSNVARCWAYETAVLLGKDVPEELPPNDYYEYFAPTYSLRVPPPYIKNFNAPQDLDHIRATCLESLRQLQHAPGVAMDVMPPDWMLPENEMDGGEVDPYAGQTAAQRRAALRDPNADVY
ncbi:unnamed protein product [Pedinophyceae sp. YPF-701]|nr:unnamed protein product [Pedinophyceae sp. YPF-701]